jgi:hypothetical protein
MTTDDFRRNIRPRTGWLRRDGDDRPWLGERSLLRRRAEQRWSTALRNIQETEEQSCSTA